MMSDSSYEELFVESIRQEILISKLYLLFSEIFPEDASFWWNLSQEEIDHASLLKTAKQFFDSEVPDSREILFSDVEVLKVANSKVSDKIDDWSSNHPDKVSAYEFAYTIEQQGQEDYLQTFLKFNDKKIADVFRKLSFANNLHSERIEDIYLKAKK